MSMFSDIWDDISGFFDDSEKEVVLFFEAIIANIAGASGKLFLDIVANAVKDAATITGPGDVKFSSARASIVDTLEKEGLPIVYNAINAAIEAAVANLKK